MDDRNDHERCMQQALKLAAKGEGWVSPNPMVGCVIVKDGRIIAEGYHKRYGEPHAERNALTNATEPVIGATMYVTLEPCCHHGKQPPCVNAIIEAGIARVIVGSGDPNPLVGGNGIALLREHGIEVIEGVLEPECRRLNRIFFHFIETGRPYVVMKYAMTLDGKIASYTGASKWITGEVARDYVHRQRHRMSAIMVGVRTVIADDPLLTARVGAGNNPKRIICDTELRTPLTSQIVVTADEIPTVIATTCEDMTKRKAYTDRGCKVISVKRGDDGIDLKMLIDILGRDGIDSVLIEGGGALHWSALSGGIVDEVQVYIAPKILGGAGALTPIEGRGFASPDEAMPLKNTEVLKLGEDYLIEGEVDRDVYRDH